MEEQLTALSPLLVKVEVLLGLVTILAVSLAWLFLEILNYVFSESEETNDDWWEALRHCTHRRLIIPPHCVEEVVEQGALSRFTTATSDAVRKMTGVVSSSLHRTLISGGGKRLSKSARKSSRQDLASLDGNAGKGAAKRKGSKSSGQAATGAEAAQAVLSRGGGSRGEDDIAPAADGLRQRKGSNQRGAGAQQAQDASQQQEAAVSPATASPVSSPEGGAPAAPKAPAPASSSGGMRTRAGSIGGAPAGWSSGLTFKNLPEDCTPLVAFVNSRSGVSQGAYLIQQLKRLLNPIQVVDLATEDPARALRLFLELPRLRILVCGGDGTAKWIMGVLEELDPDCWPPIAILPLGTGNDLARVLGWGGGYNNESIVDFLAQVQRAHVVVVDRWEMKVTTGKNRSRSVTFNNYFGIGVDAQAALKFHHLREQKPHFFFSRVVNKLWYGALGAQDLFRRSCVNLPERLKIVADGRELELPASVQGVMFLNIESWGGGVKLWDRSDEQATSPRSQPMVEAAEVEVGEEEEDEGEEAEAQLDQGQGGMVAVGSGVGLDAMGRPRTPGSLRDASMQDGMLDVVAVNGVVHLGQLQVGLSKPIKICQCREVTISTTKDLPMQVDGEPWGQQKCTIKIARKPDPAYMLKRTMDTGGAVATEMAELLDWAQSSGTISLQQRKSLLTEFSRRVEAKRRTFEQELQAVEGGGAKQFDAAALRRLAPDRPRDCVVS